MIDEFAGAEYPLLLPKKTVGSIDKAGYMPILGLSHQVSNPRMIPTLFPTSHEWHYFRWEFSSMSNAVAVIRNKREARSAGLKYTDDLRPGIQRRIAGKSFHYFSSRGRRISDEPTLNRIRQLAIPPAWTNVWICPQPLGHLQATGRDVRGRKQYRYHSEWHAKRDGTKYDRLLDFGKQLPVIRNQLRRDLRKAGLPREKVLAAVVQLLDVTHIRVGNEEYAHTNKSYGLTTMKDQHVEVLGAKLRFRFAGKSGVKHAIDLHDRRLARIVKQCQDLPGQKLFQYVGDDGKRRAITSADVNSYLRGISGQDITAKDFRTWAGTVVAASALAKLAPGESIAATKKLIVQAVAEVAERLGNTKEVCRKAYIHPAVIESFSVGTLSPQSASTPKRGLSPDELCTLSFLRTVK